MLLRISFEISQILNTVCPWSELDFIVHFIVDCIVFVKLLSGSKSGSNSTKEPEPSDAGGSLDSNRSHLSSNSKKSSLTRARNAAAKKEEKDKKESENKESKELDEYDQIERQLLADQEKELEYLNGLDQPINKADLPLLCPDENHNGPPMNEPMKLRYANKQLRFVIKILL